MPHRTVACHGITRSCAPEHQVSSDTLDVALDIALDVTHIVADDQEDLVQKFTSNKSIISV